ncbi:glycogen debranching enzyme N-terminal domain-containing protein [Verrucomicrobia bacterium]|nr:glycogen debranching enzyme N-terminal domain-containing protein [Verrucomicrobiota bacterium]
MTLKLTMIPMAGERQVCFVGDRLTFELAVEGEGLDLDRCVACLRTTIGSGSILNGEIVRAFESSAPVSHAAWQDITMEPTPTGFRLSLLLAEPGFFRAKAYLVGNDGLQRWPDGDDFGVSVHPSRYRTANTIYCAWPRLFGESRESAQFIDTAAEAKLKDLDEAGYSVIPPSGTLRDLKQALGHIVDDLGCRIIHLLPVNPTPTTFARFGRYGSPYASLDLTAIDPALVEFDKRATGIEQFCELTQEAHRKKVAVFIDLVINHTGWGSRLYEMYPEWFRRTEDGSFASPGAWGTVWEDLVELEHHDSALGDELAEVFLTWCRRGVDGFRCDAGYMVPMPLWRYITARVRREFPNAIFLLEGLGGAWEITEQLLTEGGMQWAYSELFQNYSGDQVSWYTDYALRQSQRMGLYVHYSETHDNMRLADKGAVWSLLRNHLCGLTSVSGGFGFTCGVEWLAAERIVVHQRTGLNWGSETNIVSELARLTSLLAEHPCFFDGAKLERLSEPDSTVFALERISKSGDDRVLVLVNTDAEQAATLTLDDSVWKSTGELQVDLLQQAFPKIEKHEGGTVSVTLGAGGAYCLGITGGPEGATGDAYREAAAVDAWIVGVIQQVWPEGLHCEMDLDLLRSSVINDAFGFLSAIRECSNAEGGKGWCEILDGTSFVKCFPKVVLWEPGDQRRIVPVPSGQWLLVRDTIPFEVSLTSADDGQTTWIASVQMEEGVHLVCFDADREASGRATIRVDRLQSQPEQLEGKIEFLSLCPALPQSLSTHRSDGGSELESPVALLTNGRGGMARLAIDFGQIKSKYDCLLGANLHPTVPVDRYVLAKRARIWVNAGGLITALSHDNLVSLSPGPPARWRYLICAGKGRWVPLEVTIDMIEDQNTVVIRCERMVSKDVLFEEVESLYGRSNAERAKAVSPDLIDQIPVSLTLRVDIEDRSFHSETKRNSGSDHHLAAHTKALSEDVGFVFQPAEDRRLLVSSDRGEFHLESEWCLGISHVVEASRGQEGTGDAFSPGWFEVLMTNGKPAHFVVSSELEISTTEAIEGCFEQSDGRMKQLVRQAGISSEDHFGEQLVKAVSAFVVNRDDGKTVIAGYPWFLDWGRDSLICARGLLACGYEKEVVQLLKVYGRFEESGTLPNSIHGEDTSNRETSDAPLWFGLVCADLVAKNGPGFLAMELQSDGQSVAAVNTGSEDSKTFGDVLRNIALGYLGGTPNGIRVDPESCLVWSPSHFTWMDTNHPAGTPREGYPVEIQVMWIQLLRLLEKTKIAAGGHSWKSLADLATNSFQTRYWIESEGYYADLIIASPGQSAEDGTLDTALRSNFPLAISTGLVTGERAQRAVAAALRHLMVPGGVRSLAALPVDVPLSVHSHSGQLLNDPNFPYWGRYEGDEDTRRKPAYHNGTVWAWPLGILCEAILQAWNHSPESVSAVRGYLGATGHLLQSGCIGQLPEVMDGDAPHTQRGCDAQAWSVTEAIRVWKMVS